MSEKCVVTIRVMLDTDQEEKATDMALHIQDVLPDVRIGKDAKRFVLDTEVIGHSFHGGRSFLYREPPTGGES